MIPTVSQPAAARRSRDQEDTAGLFKRLTFAGVNIVTLAEGDITHLHIGFKGTMSALFLEDLAEKTHRGFRGRVEAGKSVVVAPTTTVSFVHRSTRSAARFLVALVYVGLEDNDRAFEWLGKALEVRAWQLPMLKADTIFDPLRADSRFPALLARVRPR